MKKKKESDFDDVTNGFVIRGNESYIVDKGTDREYSQSVYPEHNQLELSQW